MSELVKFRRRFVCSWVCATEHAELRGRGADEQRRGGVCAMTGRPATMPDEDDDVPDEDDDFEMVLIADQDLEAVSVSMGEHC